MGVGVESLAGRDRFAASRLRSGVDATVPCYRAAMREISLRCTCGKLEGTARSVVPTRGFRVVCHCDDCQAYAHYLKRADQVLNEAGGTDIFQLTPAQLTLTRGTEHLACVRLTPKGLMRWYAACCDTPVANTLPWAKVAFAGVPQPFMDHAADGERRDEAVGPSVASVHGRYAYGPFAQAIHPRTPLSSAGRVVGNLLMGWLRGQARPSPFFDAATGRPVVEPTVLTPEQRDELRQHCGPNSR